VQVGVGVSDVSVVLLVCTMCTSTTSSIYACIILKDERPNYTHIPPPTTTIRNTADTTQQ